MSTSPAGGQAGANMGRREGAPGGSNPLPASCSLALGTVHGAFVQRAEPGADRLVAEGGYGDRSFLEAHCRRWKCHSCGVLRIYRRGHAWLVPEGVGDHYAAIDFAPELRRFGP